MREVAGDYKEEFKNLVGEVAEATQQIQDPVAIGMMLYQIAEERKSTNLIVKELNAKIDGLMSKISQLEEAKAQPQVPQSSGLSDRDLEVLEYVKKGGRICADTLREKFNYKGKNAASARLSKLFHEGMLEKEYAGRTVYYKIR
jgi:hypothetical protein